MPELERNADNFGINDLLTPEIRLCQGTSGEKAKIAGAKPGTFYNIVSGETYPAGFEMVIVDLIKTRTFWGTSEISDNPPLCASNEANSYESVNGEDCRKCEHLCDNAAMVDAKARREKCTIGWTIQAMMLPNLEPFTYRATGISATPTMALLTNIFYNKEAHNPANPKKIQWHRFKIPVSSAETKTPFGMSYAIKYGKPTPFGDAKFELQVFSMSAVMLGQTATAQLTEGKTDLSNQSTQPPLDQSQQKAITPPASTGSTPKIRTVGEKTEPAPATSEAPPPTEKKETKGPSKSKNIPMDV